MNSDKGYIIRIYVTDEPKDELNGSLIKMPIIPRKGDYIELNYKIENRIIHGVFLVDRVYIKQLGLDKNYGVNAEIHILGD